MCKIMTYSDINIKTLRSETDLSVRQAASLVHLLIFHLDACIVLVAGYLIPNALQLLQQQPRPVLHLPNNTFKEEEKHNHRQAHLIF